MSRHLGLLTAAAVLATACVVFRGGRELAGRLEPGNGSAHDSLIARPTASLALDRITKRQPVLNGTVRYAGTGRGAAIYVFDGGVDANDPELAGRVRVGFDAFPSRPRVCNAHGTAVAGAAAGTTLGVAPAAHVVDVKIINCATGVGSVAAIVAAARWVVNDHRQHPDHPAIANWSFIVDTLHVVPAIDSAIGLLHDAGILVVASAGNVDIDACRVSPANSHHALVVGASSVKRSPDRPDWEDVRTQGTAWGRCIDIYAPGDSVLLPGRDGDGPPTSLWNGTSMAAGYVSGAAAIVLERNPKAAPATVSRILQQKATAAVMEGRAGPPSSRHGLLLYIGL